MDELIPAEFIAGFPNLKMYPMQTMPIFLSSMVDQLVVPPYLDAIESFGVPADVCPLPSAEAGVCVEDDYPKLGKCMITCNMPCDGSIMTTTFQDRYFKLPTHVYNVPLRYKGEDVQKYAVDEIKDMIKFVEEQTGEKWNWDTFIAALESYNKQLDFELKKWDVNKTKYPQMTGATFWLYRLYYYHLSGGYDKRFLKVDKKVNKIMEKAYAKKTPCSKEMRHRAIVWSCPANYYTSFANWLENCWGINVVMDMETMISYLKFRTDTHEHALEDLAKPINAQRCVRIPRAAMQTFSTNVGELPKNTTSTPSSCTIRFRAREWTDSSVSSTTKQERRATISSGCNKTLWIQEPYLAEICVNR